MGLLFNPAEVFQIAVRIEVNGEKFYREMAKKLDDPEVVSLFSYLADEEIGHREFYEALLSQIESVEPEEDYPGEYFDYLYSYADGIIFSQEAFEKKLREIDSAEAAIEFAIGVEWDSVCEWCGAIWTEGDSPHNGGCCDRDCAVFYAVEDRWTALGRLYRMRGVA